MVNYPVVHGAVIKCRPAGVLIMENESGMDEKIIAVPVNKVDIPFGDIKDISDLSDLFKLMAQHFFEYYKYLEKGKWVKVFGWKDVTTTKKLIEKWVRRFAE